MPVVNHRGADLAYTVTELTPPWATHGETILFHHGVGASAETWASWLPGLADRYRLVCFDLRGHGGSPLPPGFHWSVDDLAGDLIAVADAAGAERFHLLGESVGATVALACAAAHGDRLISVTASNGPHRGGDVQNVDFWRGVIEKEGMAGWSKRMMDLRFHPGALPDAAWRWYEAQQATCAPSAVLDALDMLIATDLTPKLGAIETPALLLHPDDSPFVPLATMADLRAALPNARLQVFPGARHGLPFSHGPDCARALRSFIESL
jgi:pimeloyl-ACP methyl ester carboxylesterase